MSVNVGDKAPDFTLPTDGGGSVTLSKLQGKPVVIYFYPKDDTSGCTAEACGFRDTLPDYGKTGATVIGISKDSVASHDKFKAKYQLPSSSAPMATARSSRAMASGSRKACTDANTWASTVRPFSSIRRSGTRRVAQGQSTRPRRRGAEGGTGPLISSFSPLARGAAAVLSVADPAGKVALSRDLAARWRQGGMAVGVASPPARPQRPERPPLSPPRAMKRRRNLGSAEGRIALIHALAHIELNAIDLGWDIIARFSTEDLPVQFFDDWVGVAAEEAEHFALLDARLSRARR
jgi:hypothetical protein